MTSTYIYSRLYFFLKIRTQDFHFRSVTPTYNHIFMQQKLQSSDYLIVKFYVDGLFTRTHKSKVDNLGENIIDKQRARFNLEAYHEALADLVYD